MPTPTGNKKLTEMLQTISNIAQTNTTEAARLYDTVFSKLMLDTLEQKESEFIFPALVPLSHNIGKGQGTSSYVRQMVTNKYKVSDFRMYEGVDHDGLIDHSYISQPFTTAQYGFRSETNEYVDNIYDVNYFADEVNRAARQMLDFKNQLAMEMFLSSSNIFLEGNHTQISQIAAADVFSHMTVENIAVGMENQYIPKHESRGMYVVVIHKNIAQTLRHTDEVFGRIMELSNNADFLKTGTFFDIADISYYPVLEPALIQKGGGATGTDVYASIVLGGQSSIQCIPEGFEQFTARIRPYGTGDDNYYRTQEVVSKFWSGFTLLNPAAVAVYYSAGPVLSATKLPKPAVSCTFSAITADSADVVIDVPTTTGITPIDNDVVIYDARNNKVLAQYSVTVGTPSTVSLTGLTSGVTYAVLIKNEFSYGMIDPATGQPLATKEFFNNEFTTL